MQCIQSELLERLKKGCYNNEIYNYPFNDFSDIVKLEQEDEVSIIVTSSFFVFLFFSLFRCLLIYVRVHLSMQEYATQYVEPNENEMGLDDMEDFKGIPNSECGNKELHLSTVLKFNLVSGSCP
jgi:hypothetical protein